MLEKVMPLKHETLQSRVHQQLCDLILQGAFVPGESVTVASIAKALGVSPMPVREAISQLMALGALTVVSGRSVGVPRLGPAELSDLRRVRLEVETTAVSWAVARTNEVFIEQLGKILAEMEKAEEAGRVKDFIHENYKFHFAIYRQAGSPLLLEIIATLWLRITPQFHHLQAAGHYRVSNRQHHDLLLALSARDTKAAVEALRADIDSAYEVISVAVGEGDLTE